MRRGGRGGRPGWGSRVRASSVSPGLDVEEGGFAFALQDHVESVKSGFRSAVVPGGKERAARRRIGNRGQDGIGPDRWLVAEVDARRQLPQEHSCEEAQVEVRRLGGAPRAGNAARLDGGEAILAAQIGESAAKAAEPGALPGVATVRIPLP